VESADTAYILPIPDSDEYFLLENRQRLGSDAAIIGPGLLIWHIDSVLVRSRWVINTVNSATPYGVALEQADGKDDLLGGVNRGDPGDPFTTATPSFGHATAPSSLSNAGRYSYVELDSITMLAPNGPIHLQIRFDPPDVIVATDTNATFRLDGVPYNHFEDYLEPGQQYLLEMDLVQLVNNGRRRYTWVSWSDGQPAAHTFIAGQSTDSIVAAVAAEFRVRAIISGTAAGSITSDVPLDLVAGQFLARDSVVTLTATVDSAGDLFEGWFGGDTLAADPTLVLRMHRPFDLNAVFAKPLSVDLDSLPTALVATAYLYQLTANGGLGNATWQVLGTPLPAGMSLAGGGALSGKPQQAGDFPLVLRATSGSQSVVDTILLRVETPAITASDVIQQLVGLGHPLSQSAFAYLDFVGNLNGQLDLGDLLAWVDETGGAVSAQQVAAVLEAAAAAARDSSAVRSSAGRRP